MTNGKAVGTTPAVVALTQELRALDLRRDVLMAALGVLTDQPTKKTVKRVAPKPTNRPRKRMRRARYGERQALILDSAKSLTAPIEATEFLRRLGSSRKQRRLYAAALSRQIGLGRVTVSNGLVQPLAA